MNAEPTAATSVDFEEKLARLLGFFKSIERCVVAYSGGVDSAVVAKAAQLQLGDRCLACMAVSPSVATGEVEAAQRLANDIGIELKLIETFETADPRYVRNDQRRCYYCKQELYQKLEAVAVASPDTLIVNGTNTDDLGDYRPGLEAAAQQGVASPLADAGMNKEDVRRLARQWELSVWDKPATPCLSSRIAYGESVTPERLAMVDRAEMLLKDLGFRELRVRYHSGDLARIEVPVDELPRLVQQAPLHKLVEQIQKLGFRFVTLDLAGFHSGSLNQLVQITASDS